MITKAQSEGFALARGFIVFVMPAVHSVMLYSSDEVKQGWLGKMLAFLAEGPGAQLFMFLMGIFITLGRTKRLPQIVMRSLIIGGMGYLLNLLRLVIPYYLNGLPLNYLATLELNMDLSTGWQLLLLGDILQFASIAYLFGALLYKYSQNLILLTVVTITVWIISPYTWHLTSKNIVVSALLQLFNGQSPHTFFPVFPWLFYPLLGLLCGCFLKMQKPLVFLKQIVIIGILMIVAGRLIAFVEPDDWLVDFYRQGRGGTLLHSGIALVWTVLFIGLAEMRWSNLFFRLLKFLSKHITTLYIVQWIIIMWMFPLVGYNHLNLLWSLLVLTITTTLSIVVSWLLSKIFTPQKV